MIETVGADDLSSLRSTSSSLQSRSDPKYNNLQEYVPNEITNIVSRVKSIKDEIFDSNKQYTTKDLNKSLRRDLTVDDALALQEFFTRPDQEDQVINEQSNVEKVYTNKSTGEVEYPPDGGYGWVCCICAAAIQFSVWGNNSGFGVFLSFYLDNDVFPGATHMDFAWIAGLIVFNAQIFAPFAMIAVRMIGFKTTMGIACVIHFVAYLLASFATKLWQLYVCQGVIVGMCYSFLFVPAVGIIPSWFLRRRGIASGIVMSGTGIGGVFYSLTINAVIEKTGNQRWALRMIAITTTVIMATAITFIQRRNPPPKQKVTYENFKNNCKSMFALEILKAPKLWYISLWFSFMIFSYNLIVFSYASFATSIGLSQKQASDLTALLNAGQALGRPTMGLIADFIFGRINYTMILNIVIIIFILGYWMNVTSFVALLICAICFGFTLGVANVMNQVLIADSFQPENFAPAWSILNVIMAFFILFVEVIALSLKDDTLKNPYIYTQIFAGCLSFTALLFICPLRQLRVKKLLAKQKDRFVKDLEAIRGRELLGLTEEEEDDDDDDDDENVTEKEKEKEKALTEEELVKKIEKLDKLLEKGVKAYFKRLTHCVKI